MAIANVSLSDTFDNWRIRTNEVIITVNQNDTKLQSAYDTANISYVVANTGFDKANSANYYSYLVDGNTKAAFDTANIAIANVNYVNTFTQLLALDSNNATVLIAVPGYNKANAANYYSYLVDGNTQAAFLQSNTAYLVANTGYDKANSANYYAFLIDANSKASFAKGNAAHLTANTSYDKANSANIVASAAFDKANTAWTASNDGAGSGLDADLLDGQQGSYYLPTGSYTAADVLSKLLTVDGAGTGLDSDLLDGQQGAYYRDASNLNAGTVPSARLSGSYTITASAATLATKASTLSQGGGNGTAMTFNWSGQVGQPTYLWGSNDGVNHYVWTPSNFSVNYATSAGNSDTVDGYHAASFALLSGATFTGGVNATSTSSGGWGIRGYANNTGYYGILGYANAYSFYGAGTSYNAGEIQAAGDITAFYSDMRLKTNIKPIENAISLLSQISGVYYTENSLAKTFGYDNSDTQIGVLAQEVKKVVPSAVTLAPFDIEMKDGKKVSKSGENYLTVKYEKLIPLLIEAIKEQQKEIELLKSKVGE